MTWAELKKNILDLGFDDTNPDGLITSCNRAINIIFKTIEEKYEKYFVMKLSTYDSDGNITTEWTLPTIVPITTDTKDTFEIQIVDKLIDLVPLLAAHYAWLDDDVQKASQYWNEYDDLKNQLIDDITRVHKATFNGGLEW